MNPQAGKLLIIIGILSVTAGIIVYFFSDKLKWLGRLPGDIRIEREGARIYVPLATCLLLTILLNVVLWIIRRFF